MASITSTATGNWASGGTWVGGVAPGDGDTAIIANGHVVTIASSTSVTVGNSAAPATPAIQTDVATNGTGRLIVDTGATLTIKGNVVQGNANWVFNAGAVLNGLHATTTLDWKICDGTATNAILTFNGTLAARCTVQSTGAAKLKFTGPTFNNAGKIQATFTTFTSVGGSAIPFLKADNFTSAYSAFFDDCQFVSCGKFDFTNNYLAAGATFRLRRTTFRTPADSGGRSVDLLVGNGTQTGLVFDRLRCEGQIFLLGQSASAVGVSWSDVLIQGTTAVWPLDCSSTPPGGTFDLVMLHNAVTAGASPSRIMNGTITRLLSNRQGGANPHAMTIDLKSNTTITGGIFESGTTDETGDQLQLTNSPATNITLGVADVVEPPAGGLGAGSFFNISVAGANNARITIERNTCFVSGTVGAGAVITENTSGGAGVFVAIQDNLWYRATSGAGWGVFQVNGSLTNGTFTNVDYNARVNLTTDGYQPADVAFATPSPPGPHDITTAPAFVDSTRNLLTWGQSINGSLTTRQQVVDELMKRNDDAGWNAGFTLDAYYTWVRAGFVPTAAVYGTAGHASGRIGAMAPTGGGQTYAITVGGISTTIQPGWSISETANGRNRLSCDVASAAGTYRPALGADVIMTENGTRIFGGTIDTANEAGLGGLGLVPIVTKITAIDYNGLAERRYVNITIAAGNLKAALTALLPFLSPAGVTLDAAQVNGPTLPAIPLAYMRVDDVLNQLATLTGYVWEIDYNKVLRMVLPSSGAAPFNITDTPAGGALGDVTVEPSRNDYANHVLVLAGEGLREVTDNFTGNGVQTVFTLKYTLASSRGYVTNNGVFETLGTGATWSYDPAGNTITRTSAPANLSPVVIIYTAQFPVLAVATDSAALAADGGVLWEKVITEPETFDVDVAQALATAYVAQAVLKPRTARYATLQLGVHPGQTQTITKAGRNLSSTWLITDVVIRNVGGNVVERQVTATEGTVFVGSWRDTVKGWSGMRSTSGGGGVVAIISGGGSAAGSGTVGSLAQWVTVSTLGNATAVPAALLTGTVAAARLPQFTGGDVITTAAGSVVLAIGNGVVFDNNVNAGAAIAWSKINKSGSSLADLTTRSATDLSSGNLAYARMPSGSGTWTAVPTISGILTLSSDLTVAGNAGTTNFASQTTGWRITAAGGADFRSLFADELTVKSFIADLEQALAGGQIITKSVAVLAAAFTAPAAGGTTTLTVEDLPSASNMAVFVSGDTVVLRSFVRAGGALTVGDCVGVVTSYVDGAGTQSWTFTRNSGGDAGTMTASTVVAAKALVLDYGVTGNGYYEVNAIDGTNGVNSPYAQVVTWVTSPVAANRTVQLRLGRLDGISGLGTNEYGLFSGSIGATQWLRMSNQRFEVHGMNLSLYSGATEVIKLDRTAPSFSLGNPLPSAYGTGVGIWMGKDTSYKFRVGDPSGNRVAWDGINLTLVSEKLTIDNNGVAIAVPPTGFASTYGFKFSTAFTGVNWEGLFAQEPSSTARHLWIEHSTNQSGKTIVTGIQAANDVAGATISLSAVGSVSTITMQAVEVSFLGNTVISDFTFASGKSIFMPTNAGYYSFVGDSDTYYGSDTANRLMIVAGGIRVFWDGGQLFPENDNAKDLGHPSFRWRTVYAGTGTINTSDAREKTSIHPTSFGRDFLLALKPVDFRWANPTMGTGVYQGLLAQDVAAIAPAFGGVSYDAGGIAIGLNYGAFVAPLVAGFQDHEARLRALEGRG